MIDRRELMLRYLEACVATIAPGVTFPFPFSTKHRPIETDLGARVFSRAIPEARMSQLKFPAAEIIVDSAAEDVVTVSDDGLYHAEVNVAIIGYVSTGDAGTGGNPSVREQLNKFRADLIVAVESFPYWTSVDFPETARRRCGEITTTLKSQSTEAPADWPTGFLMLNYVITYTFTRYDP